MSTCNPKLEQEHGVLEREKIMTVGGEQQHKEKKMKKPMQFNLQHGVLSKVKWQMQMILGVILLLLQ